MIKGYYMGKDGSAIQINDTVRKTECINLEDYKESKKVERKIDLSIMYHIEAQRKYEEAIRADERRRIRERREAARRKAQRKRERAVANLIYFTIQKLCGFLLIIGTIILCQSGLLYDEAAQCNDWTIAILFIPVGLCLMFTKHKYID